MYTAMYRQKIIMYHAMYHQKITFLFLKHAV